MFDVGAGELIIVLLVALFVLGPDKIEQFAIKLGQLIGVCRKTWMQAGNDKE